MKIDHRINSSTSGISNDLKVLAQALDASNSGIVITDNTLPDNPIVYVNDAFEQISGYSRAEIIGHNCRFLQQQDRSQVSRTAIRKAIQEGKSCVVELRNYKKDGTLFWNELYMSPIFGDNGTVTHFVGVQNDITSRKKAELDLISYQEKMADRLTDRTRALKESKDYLNSIVQTVRESLIVLNKEHKVISVNEHFLKTFKVSKHETENVLLYDLGNGQWNIEGLKLLLEDVLPTNNPVEDFEVEHEFPYIGRKLMLVNAYRVELEGEFKDRILIAIEDITERKEIERRKDDFLSVASHELKTPLTTIHGYFQLMNKMIPENASEKFVKVMDKAGMHINRLNNLIAELLDVSKIQTGNIELHRDYFDFDKTVQEAVEGIQMVTKTHQIVVQGSTSVSYYGDESHLIQVINNLISNAIKYAPNQSDITVHLSKIGDFIKLSVADKGMGIAQDDQKKIFDRFFRVRAIQKQFSGMGIGLYICAQIISNHNGTLWVESEPGLGSTFSFTLPLTNKND